MQEKPKIHPQKNEGEALVERRGKKKSGRV
jgi:hypothetical protein